MSYFFMFTGLTAFWVDIFKELFSISALGTIFPFIGHHAISFSGCGDDEKGTQ